MDDAVQCKMQMHISSRSNLCKKETFVNYTSFRNSYTWIFLQHHTNMTLNFQPYHYHNVHKICRIFHGLKPDLVIHSSSNFKS